MKDFVVLLKALMIEENGYTEDEAMRLIEKYPLTLAEGNLRGLSALRATVMVFEMLEEEENKEDIK